MPWQWNPLPGQSGTEYAFGNFESPAAFLRPESPPLKLHNSSMKALRSVPVVLLLSLQLLHAQSRLAIVTWNCGELFHAHQAEARASDLRSFASELRPDVIALQEVASRQTVEAIRTAMQLEGYHLAVSDFASDPDVSHTEPFAQLEVAVLSRFPLGRIVEVDVSSDTAPVGGSEEPPEIPDGLNVPVAGTARGALSVEIPALELTLTVVHLKSSRGLAGSPDAANARKREYVVAAAVEKIADLAQEFPDHRHLLVGDFNVGHSDLLKNGVDLSEDHFEDLEPGVRDGYEETHFLVESGIVRGVGMVNLAKHILATTYPGFPGSPIDNICVTRDHASQFSPAYKASRTYGSDHLPVLTTYRFEGDPEEEPATPAVPEATVVIVRVLPNPVGSDIDREEVSLINQGTDSINLNGWTLADTASHTLRLTGALAGNQTRTFFMQGQVLNNTTPEELFLRDAAGREIDRASYEPDQVQPGQAIEFAE